MPFTCQPDCGKCCDEPGGIVYLRPEDAKIMASHHEMVVEEWLEEIAGKHLMEGGSSNLILLLTCAFIWMRIRNVQLTKQDLHNANHIHSGQKMCARIGHGKRLSANAQD